MEQEEEEEEEEEEERGARTGQGRTGQGGGVAGEGWQMDRQTGRMSGGLGREWRSEKLELKGRQGAGKESLAPWGTRCEQDNFGLLFMNFCFFLQFLLRIMACFKAYCSYYLQKLIKLCISPFYAVALVSYVFNQSLH